MGNGINSINLPYTGYGYNNSFNNLLFNGYGYNNGSGLNFNSGLLLSGFLGGIDVSSIVSPIDNTTSSSSSAKYVNFKDKFTVITAPVPPEKDKWYFFNADGQIEVDKYVTVEARTLRVNRGVTIPGVGGADAQTKVPLQIFGWKANKGYRVTFDFKAPDCQDPVLVFTVSKQLVNKKVYIITIVLEQVNDIEYKVVRSSQIYDSTDSSYTDIRTNMLVKVIDNVLLKNTISFDINKFIQDDNAETLIKAEWDALTAAEKAQLGLNLDYSKDGNDTTTEIVTNSVGFGAQTSDEYFETFEDMNWNIRFKGQISDVEIKTM